MSFLGGSIHGLDAKLGTVIAKLPDRNIRLAHSLVSDMIQRESYWTPTHQLSMKLHAKAPRTSTPSSQMALRISDM